MPTAVEQLEAFRSTAGVATISSGWIAVTGADRVRWLNGMVTNSVQALTPGDGAYSFLLSAQGRIQGDLTVWAQPDRLLLQTSPEQVEPILTLLDRFIIMDDVELCDISAQCHGITLIGQAAADILGALGIKARPSRLLKRLACTWEGNDLTLISAFSPRVPRFELWSADADVVQRLQQALQQQGALPCDAEGLELLRIVEGTPRFGTDIRDRDLPQETAQTRALHFAKGCYLGQEIVERIRSRGSVHRTFTTVAITGSVPTAGTTLEAAGKPVGELTSVAGADVDGRRLALGFIRREALDRGLVITYSGGSVEPVAATEPTVAAS